MTHIGIVFHGGGAADNAVFGNVFHNSALRTDSDIVLNFQMSGNSRLSCESAPVAYFGRTGNADLGNDKTFFTDLHIMPDLYEVINACAVGANAAIERAALSIAAFAPTST